MLYISIDVINKACLIAVTQFIEVSFNRKLFSYVSPQNNSITINSTNTSWKLVCAGYYLWEYGSEQKTKISVFTDNSPQEIYRKEVKYTECQLVLSSMGKNKTGKEIGRVGMEDKNGFKWSAHEEPCCERNT